MESGRSLYAVCIYEIPKIGVRLDREILLKIIYYIFQIVYVFLSIIYVFLIIFFWGICIKILKEFLEYLVPSFLKKRDKFFLIYSSSSIDL